MDMLVNRNNYELYVLDFLDGKLSEKENEVFARFLADHPDILEEVMNIDQIKLQPGDITYPDKSILKKAISQESVNIPQPEFRDHCIAYLEGDLSQSEMKEFEEYLEENPEKIPEFESFQKAYLKPDISIVFSSKSKLKKLTAGQRRIRIISFISGAAAIVVIALLLYQPGVDYVHQLITGRDVVTDSQKELSSGSIGEENNRADQTNKMIQQDSDKEEQEIGIAQVPGNVSIKRKTSAPEKEIQYEEAIVREDISLRPISSFQAHLEVQIPDLSGPSGFLSPKDTEAPEEYLTVVEFATEHLRRDIFRKNDSGQDNRLTFWDLAYNGFNGLDRISEGSYALNRDVDEEGSVKRIMFETPVIGLSLPLKNNKNLQ